MVSHGAVDQDLYAELKINHLVTRRTLLTEQVRTLVGEDFEIIFNYNIRLAFADFMGIPIDYYNHYTLVSVVF